MGQLQTVRNSCLQFASNRGMILPAADGFHNFVMYGILGTFWSMCKCQGPERGVWRGWGGCRLVIVGHSLLSSLVQRRNIMKKKLDIQTANRK